MGGAFHFNPHHPGLLALGSQDYNGAVTRDGGASWAYLEFSGHSWGGFVYGAFAADEEVVFGGVAKSWKKDIRLAIRHADGERFEDIGHELTGLMTSMVDPADPGVLFCYEWRSGDLGRTWEPMDGCRGVLASDASGGSSRLFGGDGSRVVASSDAGLTWETAADLPAEVKDVAVDAGRDRLWAVAGRSLFRVDLASGEATDVTKQLPVDGFGRRHLDSVAVDPVDPDVVYACGSTGVYHSDASVVRSTDGGETWSVLTVGPRFDNREAHGHASPSAFHVRVHPETRDAWFASGCEGLWRIGPPAGD